MLKYIFTFEQVPLFIPLRIPSLFHFFCWRFIILWELSSFSRLIFLSWTRETMYGKIMCGILLYGWKSLNFTDIVCYVALYVVRCVIEPHLFQIWFKMALKYANCSQSIVFWKLEKVVKIFFWCSHPPPRLFGPFIFSSWTITNSLHCFPSSRKSVVRGIPRFEIFISVLALLINWKKTEVERY